MKKFYLFFWSLISAMVFSQYSTPGNGSTYSLNSLSTAAPTALVNNGTYYQMTTDFTLSNGDILVVSQSDSLKIDGGVTFIVAGKFSVTAPKFVVTPTILGNPYKGIKFETTSIISIKNTTFLQGGGIRVSTGNFLMDNCIVKNMTAGLVTGSAMSFSEGKPTVQNSQFIENSLPAFSSGANQTVSAVFFNNYIYKNTQNNSNRPQINMGPSGSDTLKIVKNMIIGDRTITRAGGISASTLLGLENHVIIEDNTISDNRYGITIGGTNTSAVIQRNVIENNNTENNPALGGSGISLSGNGSQVMDVKVYDNKFRGNLYGITVLGNARANLGDANKMGNNVFKDNGNSGKIYALYNNTPNNIIAENNCWRENELSDDAMVDEVIFDRMEDAALGAVSYKPYKCAKNLANSEALKLKLNVFPIPNNGNFFVDAASSGNIVITNISGQMIYNGIIEKGRNKLQIKSVPGVYVITYISANQKISKKLIVK